MQQQKLCLKSTFERKHNLKNNFQNGKKKSQYFDLNSCISVVIKQDYRAKKGWKFGRLRKRMEIWKFQLKIQIYFEIKFPLLEFGTLKFHSHP